MEFAKPALNRKNFQKNNLGTCSSPYLLQHAHHPIHWQPWSPEILEAAQKWEMPIFVSSGYSACHWCHVMSEESFEDPKLAAYLNSHFLCVKLDREEHPHLDAFLMESLLQISRHGGWPLNMFMTPDGKPFFGGTYFPPHNRNGQAGFFEVASAVLEHFKSNRNSIEERSAQLIKRLRDSSKAHSLAELERKWNQEKGEAISPEGMDSFLVDTAKKTKDELMDFSDPVHGGFGGAPKFPQPPRLDLLLSSCDATQRKQGLLTLEKMVRGGIFDTLNGGFSRYSVDNRWTVPHFEKMLYDNAQLLPLLAKASVMSASQSTLFLDAYTKTIGWLKENLYELETRLFCSGLDADSEGEEGIYYTFTFEEIIQAIGDNEKKREFLLRHYNLTRHGAFEGRNILTRAFPLEESAEKSLITREQALEWDEDFCQSLRLLQKNRPQPALDDKCLLGWNARLVSGLLESAAWLGCAQSRDLGLGLLTDLESRLAQDEEGLWWRVLSQGAPRLEALLEDLSALLEAYSWAWSWTSHTPHLQKAEALVKTLHKNHVEPLAGLLRETSPLSGLDLCLSQPEDHVMPSSHSHVIWGAGRFLHTASDQIASDKKKMWGALHWVALSNAARVAWEHPTATARLGLWGDWTAEKPVIAVEAPSPDAGLAAISSLHAEWARAGKGPLLWRLQTPTAQNPLNSGSVTFSLCTVRGCFPPVSQVKQILSEE